MRFKKNKQKANRSNVAKILKFQCIAKTQTNLVICMCQEWQAHNLPAKMPSVAAASSPVDLKISRARPLYNHHPGGTC